MFTEQLKLAREFYGNPETFGAFLKSLKEEVEVREMLAGEFDTTNLSGLRTAIEDVQERFEAGCRHYDSMIFELEKSNPKMNR